MTTTAAITITPAAPRPTTIVQSPRLAKRLGMNLILASETLQYTGSFKFRGAYNVASRVRQNLIITASSGNFGQALAYACSLLNKKCIVVMPATSANVKIAAVKEFGGTVDLIDVNVTSRDNRLAELAQEHPEAYVAGAYDDPLVIEGNSSLGRELAALDPQPEIVLSPMGGGGLISGIITGIQDSHASITVMGAEPLLANDAARSLRAGEIIRNEKEQPTIADGARTISLGKHNWAILRVAKPHVVEVPEEKIADAVRLLFELANLKAEPTGALTLGAVLTQPDLFQGRSVCCVVSGGNVDPALYGKILSGEL